MTGVVFDGQDLLIRISNLVDFLRLEPVSMDALMTHLLVDTFYGQPAFGHILNVVGPDGKVAMPAKSGFRSWPAGKSSNISIILDTPLTRSLRTEQVVSCGALADYPFSGTVPVSDVFPYGFAFSIAWPVPGLGSVLTFYSEVIDLTFELSSWLAIVGKVISLSFRDITKIDAVVADGYVVQGNSEKRLTSRQWNILAGVRRGKTNPEIAEDLGFSESLVKQETMSIYRLLDVSGRKQILEMSDEDFLIHTI